MASTFTTNCNLELQGTGDNAGTWGTVLNTAALAIVDQVLGGVQTLSLSNVDVNVSTSQSQNNAILLTGTLTGNVNVNFPAIGRTYFISNGTTGNFTVTLRAGTNVLTQVIPTGQSGYFTFNVNSVYAPTLPGVPAGAVMAFAMATVPFGWLECDGTAVSRTTYAALFAQIGTTYGAGNGTTTFNLPDLRGYFVRGWSHGSSIDSGRALGSTQTSANLAHTHTGTAASHTHTATAAGISRRGANGSNTGTSWYGSSGDSTSGGVAQLTTAASGALNLTIADSGGTEARPISVALMYCVKF